MAFDAWTVLLARYRLTYSSCVSNPLLPGTTKKTDLLPSSRGLWAHNVMPPKSSVHSINLVFCVVTRVSASQTRAKCKRFEAKMKTGMGGLKVMEETGSKASPPTGGG